MHIMSKSHCIRFVLGTLVCLMLIGSSAQAGSWVFRRSYYTHDPVTPVRIGKAAVNGPHFSRPQGAYFSGGYRWNRSQINISGHAYDHVNIFESWYQTGSQF